MTIARSNDLVWDVRGLYDNELWCLRTWFSPDQYIRADSANDAPHHGGTAQTHATKSYLMENRNLDFLIDGGWEFTWEWEDGDFTEAQIDDFLALHPMPSQWTTTKDWTNRRITSTCSDTNYAMNSWTSREPAYYLKSADRKLKCTASGTFFCLTIRNGNFSNYTIEVRTVEPNGGTLTVDKQGTTCYVIPLRDMTVGSNTIEQGRAYKLTSTNIVVTNSDTERGKIVRLYK